MKLIGLTGGIGSGKTTVAMFFIKLGVPVYFADNEAKNLMNSSALIRKKLIKEFGKKAFEGDQLNRAYLAAIVFKDKNKLSAINAIVHPEVRKHFLKWVTKQTAPYLIQENAIMFENDTASQFDYTITISAPILTRIKRVIQRDAVSEKEVLVRMNNQWDDSKKVELADFVIENIELKETKRQVNLLHKKLLKISTSKS